MSILDKTEWLAPIVGTITRGLLWVSSFAVAKLGVEGLSESTAAGLAECIGGIILAALALVWSKKKDKKLADS